MNALVYIKEAETSLAMEVMHLQNNSEVSQIVG